MSKSFAWDDTSKQALAARNWLRKKFQLRWAKPQTDERPDAHERFPNEYFKCSACGTGPWHITWGAICPNCSGAD